LQDFEKNDGKSSDKKKDLMLFLWDLDGFGGSDGIFVEGFLCPIYFQ